LSQKKIKFWISINEHNMVRQMVSCGILSEYIGSLPVAPIQKSLHVTWFP